MNTSIVILLGSLAVGQAPTSFVVRPGFVVKHGELPRSAPKPVPLTRNEAIARAKAAGKPLVIVQGCTPPKDAMWDSHVSPGDSCRTEVWGYHDGWMWLVEEVPEACDAGRVRGILGRWRAPVSDEERRGILPKNRLRWQPYAQPDYQGRMRRQTGFFRAAPRLARGGNC